MASAAAYELQARRNDVVPVPPGAESLGARMPASPRSTDLPPAAFEQVEQARQRLAAARDDADQPDAGQRSTDRHTTDRQTSHQQVPEPRRPPELPAEDRRRLTPERSSAGSREHHDRPDLTRADPDHDREIT